MKNIYDNGNYMLGQAKRIKEYNDYMYKNEMICVEQWIELAKELVLLNDTDIITIDYDNGMGLLIEKWGDKDILKNMEEEI